jgi:hypothetical protein
MSTNYRTIDWGGNDLIVKSLRLADKPGLPGTAATISATELGFLDGVTAGTATASKAVVLGASKEIATLGAVTMGALTATTGSFSGAVGLLRTVVEDGASVALTAGQSGALCVFDKTDGALFTLPAPVVGLYYDFVVDTVVSSGSAKVITNAGTVFIQGTVNAFVTGTDADLAADAANGSTHVAVTMNGTTTGGIAGTRFRLTCRTATKWQVEGDIIKSGTVATSFTTS